MHFICCALYTIIKTISQKTHTKKLTRLKQLHKFICMHMYAFVCVCGVGVCMCEYVFAHLCEVLCTFPIKIHKT